MPFVRIPKDLFYYVGEKPPSLPCEYVDRNKAILTSAFDGATLVALCSLDGGTEFTVTCTNPQDGTFTVDWPTGGSDSAFTAKGGLRIDVKVTDGTHTWYLPRFTVEIRARS